MYNFSFVDIFGTDNLNFLEIKKIIPLHLSYVAKYLVKKKPNIMFEQHFMRSKKDYLKICLINVKFSSRKD